MCGGGDSEAIMAFFLYEPGHDLLVTCTRDLLAGPRPEQGGRGCTGGSYRSIYKIWLV